jgi:hypothetical protein
LPLLLWVRTRRFLASQCSRFRATDRNITEITRGVEGVLECWCYGQHCAPTNSRDGSILNGSNLPQHADELLLAIGTVRLYLA